MVYRSVAGYKVATEEAHALAHRPESVHMNLLKGVLHIHMLYADVSVHSRGVPCLFISLMQDGHATSLPTGGAMQFSTMVCEES